jgi:hypothetical protein
MATAAFGRQHPHLITSSANAKRRWYMGCLRVRKKEAARDCRAKLGARVCEIMWRTVRHTASFAHVPVTHA